jgi:hypothetical protein
MAEGAVPEVPARVDGRRLAARELRPANPAMYCSYCGAKAEGNFCWSCGARLGTDGGAAPALETTQDWSHEIRYYALMRMPEVREKVARASASVRRSVSGEDFLALFDKVMPMDVPLEKLALIAQPLGERLGLKTGKERSELIGKPPGQTLVAALCSLARHGQTPCGGWSSPLIAACWKLRYLLICGPRRGSIRRRATPWR